LDLSMPSTSRPLAQRRPASAGRSVAETIQAKVGPWLQVEIARLVRDEISRAKRGKS